MFVLELNGNDTTRCVLINALENFVAMCDEKLEAGGMSDDDVINCQLGRVVAQAMLDALDNADFLQTH